MEHGSVLADQLLEAKIQREKSLANLFNTLAALALVAADLIK